MGLVKTEAMEKVVLDILPVFDFISQTLESMAYCYLLSRLDAGVDCCL